jgi:hypothetical protein
VLRLLGLVAVVVLIHLFGASFSAAVGVYLGYRVYALTAGDEANICISQVQTDTDASRDTGTGNFIIVDYSEKAIAVFGDTKPVKGIGRTF